MSKFRDFLSTHKNVNSSSLQFVVATDMAIEDTGEKGVKVHLKARAKEPVDHPLFGRVVHDFGSVTIKNKIAIDHEHDKNIGYAKHFSITDYGLEIDGLIFKNTENPQHPANEVLYNFQNSIPQEVSIDFRGPYEIEEVSADEQVMVNGILFSDGLIIRNWTLKKVAICALGQDSNTEAIAQFAQSEILNPTNMDKFMSTQTPEDGQSTETPVEAVVQPETTPDKSVLAVPQAEPVEDAVKPEGKPVVDTEEEVIVEAPKADDAIVEELKKRIAELESQLSSQKDAEQMHLQTIDKLVLTHKKVSETFGAEPIAASLGSAKEFKDWQTCVSSVMTQYGLGDSDAHCRAIKLYPEFHKQQTIKFSL